MRLSTTVMAVLLVAAVMVMAGDEKPWFDMTNCGMCKHLMENPETLKHTTWEQHNIKNGIVCVTTVDKEYLEAYRKASKIMSETAEKLMAGEEVQLCGSCTSLGAVFQKGLQSEMVQTEHGSVDLFTSDNPEVVKEVQAWAARNQEEMKKMMAAE